MRRSMNSYVVSAPAASGVRREIRVGSGFTRAPPNSGRGRIWVGRPERGTPGASRKRSARAVKGFRRADRPYVLTRTRRDTAGPTGPGSIPPSFLTLKQSPSPGPAHRSRPPEGRPLQELLAELLGGPDLPGLDVRLDPGRAKDGIPADDDGSRSPRGGRVCTGPWCSATRRRGWPGRRYTSSMRCRAIWASAIGSSWAISTASPAPASAQTAPGAHASLLPPVPPGRARPPGRISAPNPWTSALSTQSTRRVADARRSRDSRHGRP